MNTIVVVACLMMIAMNIGSLILMRKTRANLKARTSCMVSIP